MALVRTGLIGVLLILIGLTVWGWWVVISHFTLGDYHNGGTVLVALVVAGCMTVWLVDVARSLKLNLAAAPESGARLIFSPHPSDTDRVTPKSEHGRLIDHVKELSDRAGLPQVPRIYVSSDSFAHGAAAGIRHRRNYIVVSDFALERFDDTELKGLVAHEIAHLLQRDSLILVLIDLVAGGLLKIPRFLAGTTKIVLLIAAIPAFFGFLVALYEEGPAVLIDVVEAGVIYAAVLATPFILLLAIGWPAAAIQRAVELRSLRAVQFLSPEGFAEERGIYDTVPTYKELVDSVKRLGGTADRRLEAFERDAETFGQRYGNLLLISRSACPRFLAFCKAAGAGILGIDCFRLDQGQPVARLEPMADFSELRASAIGTFRSDSLRRSRAFVDEVVEPDMWCEFVVDLPDSDDLMQSILQTLEDPSNNDMVGNSPNDPEQDPWAAVPIGVHLGDTGPAGTYKIDGEGNCGPVSLGLVDMVWGELEPFGGPAGLSIEAVLYGLDAEDKAALHRTPVSAATREGEPCHLPAVSLHRIDGSEFPAEVWSYPEMRDGQVFGTDVYVLDRSQPLKAALLVDTDAICRAASMTAQVFFFGRMDDKLRLEGTDLRLLLESSTLWEAVTRGTDFAAAIEVRPFLGDPFRTHLRSRPIAAEDTVIGAALSIADPRTSELHRIDKNGVPNPAFERPSTVRGA